MTKEEPKPNGASLTPEQYEKGLAKWVAKSPGDDTIYAAGLAGVIGFATTAINASILLNGAAATALLAFVASVSGSTQSGTLEKLLPQVKNCLFLFSFGAGAAVVSAILAYFAQSLFNDLTSRNRYIDNSKLVNPQFTANEEFNKKSSRLAFFGELFRVAGILAILASIASFAVGVNEGVMMFDRFAVATSKA